jgi:hypothetical protein
MHFSFIAEYQIDNTPCIVVVRYYRTQKTEESLKEMNALLILKTTRSSNVRQNCLANTELAFQNEQRKRAAELINANNELIFQNEKK